MKYDKFYLLIYMTNYNQYEQSTILSCYMPMVSHWDIFIVVLFVAYMARLAFSKSLCSFLEIIIFLLKFCLIIFFLISFCSSKKFLSIYKQHFLLYNLCMVYYICQHIDILFCNHNSKLMLLISNSLFSVFFFYWYNYTLKIGINNKWSH